MKKRFFSRFGLILLFFLMASANLAGCSAEGEELLWYQNGTIEAEISGQVNGVEIAGRIKLFGETVGAKKRFELMLSAPKSLEGTVFRREADGSLTVEVGDVRVTLPEGEKSGAVIVAEMLSLSDEPIRISTVTGVDAGLSQYEKLTKAEFLTVTVLIDPVTSLPVRLTSDLADIFILTLTTSESAG